MSANPGNVEPSDWNPRSVIMWLLEEGRLLSGIDELANHLGDRLLACGAPVWRLRVAMRTLHPLVTAVTSVWERDGEVSGRIESPHGLENRPDYRGSPFEIVARTRAPFRKRLTCALTDTDHNVLHEVKARGGTDYFGLPMPFSDGATAILVIATDAKNGFSDADLKGLAEVASVLAPIVEVFSSKRVSRAVAEAYLGPRTGQRVLDGNITRGDIEKITAAILVSDIRDWTGLNSRVSAEEALALANRYFEVIADAVESNHGEILKFIGDGVLAVFPVDEETPDVTTVCKRALAAARQALRTARELVPPLDLSFGIGMHFGEVLYGNIGSTIRLDFTVLGQAVNTAARIEGMCGKLGKPVLFSQEFADNLPGPTVIVARQTLKGHDARSNLLTTSDDP